MVSHRRAADYFMKKLSLDEAQAANLTSIMEAGYHESDPFMDYAEKSKLAEAGSMRTGRSDYKQYMLGKFIESSKEAKEALRHPETAQEFMNKLTLPNTNRPVISAPQQRLMERAKVFMEGLESKEEIRRIQEKTGANPDGIIGPQTQTAIANYMQLVGEDKLTNKQKGNVEATVGSLQDVKDSPNPLVPDQPQEPVVEQEEPLTPHQAARAPKPFNMTKEYGGKSYTYRVHKQINAEFDIPKSSVDHLVNREGVVYSSYPDSEGKPTAGIGHLLTEEEQKKYPLGTDIPQSQVIAWFNADSKKAYNAARKQAKEMGQEDNTKFIDALVSVNFQLGTAWGKEFPTAYSKLVQGDYDYAIEEIKYTSKGSGVKSKWSNQTPDRVSDFVKAIKDLKNRS